MTIITSLESHLDNVFLTSDTYKEHIKDSLEQQEAIDEHIKWLEDKIKSITNWSYNIIHNKAWMRSFVDIVKEDHPKLFKNGDMEYSMSLELEKQVLAFGKAHSMTIYHHFHPKDEYRWDITYTRGIK